MGNSGTATRLMMGVLSNHEFEIKITGDKSLTKRPMDRIIEPLIKMGAEIKSNNNKLPITLTGVSETLPIKYILPIPSAQVKSSILLASLGTPGKTTIIENIPTRDHTEILLKKIVPKNKILCEPQMGKRGLYPTLSTKKEKNITRNYMSFLQYSDGKNSLDEISKILNINDKLAKKIYFKLKNNNLIY